MPVYAKVDFLALERSGGEFPLRALVVDVLALAIERLLLSLLLDFVLYGVVEDAPKSDVYVYAEE